MNSTSKYFGKTITNFFFPKSKCGCLILPGIKKYPSLKRYPPISTTLALAVLALGSCRKDTNFLPTTSSTTKDNTLKSLRREAKENLADLVKVSEYGFLVLNDSASLTAYTKFIDSNETSDVEAFLSSINFVSQATAGDKSDNYIAPSASNTEYLFNASGMVQIGDVVIRGVTTKGYFLAMPMANLDANSYDNLRDGKFDANTMCRLKIGKEYENVLEFVQGNVGLDDVGTGATNPHPTPQNKWVTTKQTVGNVTYERHDFYLFGILWRSYTTITINNP